MGYSIFNRVPLVLPLIFLAFGCHEVHLDYSQSPGEIVLYDDLYSVSMPDDSHAVAVGYYGSAYFTSDGGETWSQGVTDTLTSLYKVSMADALHGWAVGQRGLILRTEDGGAHWVRQPNSKEKEGVHLFGVAAIDANSAVAIGEWGTRIRTEDGGKTWDDYSFTVTEEHPMFQWLSPFEQEKVRKGETVFEDVGLNDVYCLGAPSLSCWLIGEFGYIFYSEDGGKSWHKSNIEGSREIEPVRFGYNEVEFDSAYVEGLSSFARSVIDEAHLNVAVEAVANEEEIQEFGREGEPIDFFETLEARMQEVRTVLEDAGLESERVRLRGQPPWDYEDYLEEDPRFLERYYESRLFGYPGVKVRVIQNPILFTVRFRDENNGMISGLGGVTLSTQDGGKNWAYGKLDRKMAVFSVASVADRALAVGEKGLVRVSLDGGRTWEPPAEASFPRLFTFMRDMTFDPTGKIGLVVGQSGRILRSDDSGREWVSVLPPPEESGNGG
ncbi:MAG: YCF48-related protein [Myxococcota bacterium]|nr:YCF48-related protein [Myxococcota bacterium]